MNFEVEPDEGQVNARVTITPLNDTGKGKRSTFLMPTKDMNYLPQSQTLNNTVFVLANYWHLFSERPEEVLNRPKQMHIYLDVSDDDIKLDKELLAGDDYRFTAKGDYRIINDEMYRWSINKDSFKILSQEGFREMIPEEIIFIRHLINSFNDIFRRFITSRGIGQGTPVVFKLAAMNPKDHKDSIIIYLMKGKRWEI